MFFSPFGIVSAQGGITKYHTLSSLNNKYLFVTVLKAEKPRIKAPADSMSAEGCFAMLKGRLLTMPSQVSRGRKHPALSGPKMALRTCCSPGGGGTHL